MSRKLIYWAFFCAVFFLSCKKIALKTENPAPTIATTTFPSYFSWETSKDIKVTLGITDVQFGNSKYLISIYDGDPLAGGAILCKGSATLKKPFVSTVYLGKKYTVLYVLKTSPNNARTVHVVDVGTTDITASLGARVNSSALTTDKIPSRFVF